MSADRSMVFIVSRPAIVDGRGLPIRLALAAGQDHDASLINELLEGLPRGAMLLGDRAYDADKIRAGQAERGGWANIPPKRNRVNPIVFSPFLYKQRNLIYKQRNLIERFFSKIKHFRRIATRYDKLAANFLAALKLVAVRLWLRHYESTT